MAHQAKTSEGVVEALCVCVVQDTRTCRWPTCQHMKRERVLSAFPSLATDLISFYRSIFLAVRWWSLERPLLLLLKIPASIFLAADAELLGAATDETQKHELQIFVIFLFGSQMVIFLIFPLCFVCDYFSWCNTPYPVETGACARSQSEAECAPCGRDWSQYFLFF